MDLVVLEEPINPSGCLIKDKVKEHGVKQTLLTC